MVWYLKHQVKGRTSGTQKSIGATREQILRNPYGGVANFLKQDTIIIGLPDGCVGHDIHLTGYRETNIIVLGKCSNHHICLRFRSGWCQNNPNSSSLGRTMKDCNTNRRDDVARFSGMNYDSKLRNMSWFCYIHVNTLSQTSITT